MPNESQCIEYKESWNDDYLKWICGFANAQGGTLYIGLDDMGKIVGLKNAKKLMEDIPNKVRDILGIIVDVNLHSEIGKEYIEIIVNKYPYGISYKGEYHYRTGSTKQILKGSALIRFLLQRQGVTWDSITVPEVSIKDFREDSFSIFRELALARNRLSEEDLALDNLQLLEKLDLIEDGLFRKAAILLFHHNAEKWAPGAYIRIGYFPRPGEIEYQDEVHGSLLEQATKAVDLIFLKYLKARITFRKWYRSETYPVPPNALKEAIYNSIIHRDYSSVNPILIKVYHDKIFIGNCGYLPTNWTVDNLFEPHNSVPFNPYIARTFYRTGMIETWGRGIEKMVNGCVEEKVPLPRYVAFPGDINIIFSFTPEYVRWSETVDMRTQPGTVAGPSSGPNLDSLTEVQIKILTELSQKSDITQRELASNTGLARSTIINNIATLKNYGILIRIGSSQKGHWQIVDSFLDTDTNDQDTTKKMGKANG
ncbi:MAG: ATP-binding protein [Planctomycetia bacterium]|nr:ATP-binding protein [Planctomycetia bacterium]